jgi:4-hydroxy-2-oxoheptanedioate aldolase
MVEKRNLKKAIKDGEPLLGIFELAAEPDVIEVLGYAGLDFALLDGEHGDPRMHSSLSNMTRAADVVGMGTIVRFANNDFMGALIGHALDAGADGFQISDVENGETMEKIVQAAYFGPRGSRSIYPVSRAGNFGWRPLPEFIEWSNERVVAMVQVETTHGFEHLDEILANDALDAVFIGTMDLSQSMGLTLQTQHEKVQGAVHEIARRVLESGKALGYRIDTPDQAKYWLDLGARILYMSGGQLWKPFGNLVHSIREVVDE